MTQENIDKVAQVLANFPDEIGMKIITDVLEQTKGYVMDIEKQKILQENVERILESQVPIQNAIDYLVGGE